MKVAIVGTGAIGGLMAARFAKAGYEVSVLARGRTLAAIREQGLRLVTGGEMVTVTLPASDDPEELGPQDTVILAVKAYSVPSIVPLLPSLFKDDTTLVPAVNGIPWWYFHQAGTRFEERPLDSVDPEGAIWQAIDRHRIVGCIVYPAASVPEPGVVHHAAGERFVLGEPSGQVTERLKRLIDLFRQSAFDAELTTDVRTAIWQKLWGNATFNPLSVLTGATADLMCGDTSTRAVLTAAMQEVAAVAEAIGIKMGLSIEARIEEVEKLGAIKTSMLQDYEAGRSLELDALLAAVIEIGQGQGVETPLLKAVHALTKLRARTTEAPRAANS